MFRIFGKVLTKLMGGTRNERIIRSRMTTVVERINPLEQELLPLSDEELLARSAQLRDRLADGESRNSIFPEAFALVREVTRRALTLRLFDVQLVAAMVLDEGWIAEEATGEGKTFACYPAIFMAVLAGKHVHVVTVNDYLVERDAGFAGPVFERLGYTVGFIASGMRTPERKEQYVCNVTYGTNSEFGFDYLRDNMKLSVADQVQGPLDFAIIDEVDSILIDEARTPLIISGPSVGKTDRYGKADSVARHVIQKHLPWQRTNDIVEALKRDLRAAGGEQSKVKGDDRDQANQQVAEINAKLEKAEDELYALTSYYEIELDKKAVNMTHEGIGAAQDFAGVGSFYVGANVEWPHLMDQSLRAHLVYEKDVDYVVNEGKVVIVDQFTGRLMEGREWSDGLHQAVEAKERVTVKQENQTLATITLQNFYRLYDRLAGMTGTAMTEAGEFLKIYKLDVAAVATHRPINRVDHNDRIYADEGAKYRALVEEINEVSKAGRPVLVGTTSVEKSEHLSEMLTRTYGVKHEVLNARPDNAAREADIVSRAGHRHALKQGGKETIGNVTIATNMAGRGTDIKLGEGVVYEKCRVPTDDEMAAMGLTPDPLYPAGVNKCCIHCQQHDPATNCARCFKPKVDEDFPVRGRVDCTEEVPCGLHIVGTERHEARRIDNQLRGRSGRQGDPGSSRFFLSLRDELMAIFAGDWAVKVLSWLGLQGDAMIEDKRISKGIERAQKKVEERNYEIRKNLLEYDEVMDLQRKGFYGRRQAVLELRQLDDHVMELLENSVTAAVDDYLQGNYAARCIAEWAQGQLQMPFNPASLHVGKVAELPVLEDDLRSRAKNEAINTIGMTLGEYMSDDIPPAEWDLRGLSGWAMSRFHVNISQNQLRKMEPRDVETELIAAAGEKIDQVDMAHLARYLEEGFAERSLSDWGLSKLGILVPAEELAQGAEKALDTLLDAVGKTYHQRGIEYPVEAALEMTLVRSGTDNVYACGDLAGWVNAKYATDFDAEHFRGKKLEDTRDELVAIAHEWAEEGKLRQTITDAIGDQPSIEAATTYAADRFRTPLTADDFDGDVLGRLELAGQQLLRREFANLEQYILLQVYDSSWKDHLLAMDHLRDGIGLTRGPTEDPKVKFKQEGAAKYQEMLDSVQDKVTDLIFKVRLESGEQRSSVYEISSAAHSQASAYDTIARDAADQQRAAEPAKAETIRRVNLRVGRNDPCPCGSGKKYKKCCGKEA